MMVAFIYTSVDVKRTMDKEPSEMPLRSDNYVAQPAARRATSRSRLRRRFALAPSTLISLAVVIAMTCWYQLSLRNQTAAKDTGVDQGRHVNVVPQHVSEQEPRTQSLGTQQTRDQRRGAIQQTGAAVPIDIQAMNSRLLAFDEVFSHFKIDMQRISRENQRLHRQNSGIAFWMRAMAIGRIELPVVEKSGRTATQAPENSMPFVYVPPGSFQMGHTEKERIAGVVATTASHFDFSIPNHPVRMETGFFIGVHEIPVIQYEAFLYDQQAEALGRNLDRTRAGIDQRLPATNVDWKSAVNFCKWLTKKSGVEVRLPTETEWEYAARGNHFVQDLTGNRDGEVVVGGPWPVTAQNLDRSWCGCIGMNSNVQEWCLDAWNEGAYQDRVAAPAQPFSYKHVQRPSATSSLRVVRGSSYQDVQANRDPAIRRFKSFDSTEPTVGFRVVMPIPSFSTEAPR